MKEREAQIEMRKILEQLNRDQEQEIERQTQKLLEEKDKIDENSYRKKQESIQQLNEYHKRQ